MYSDYQKATFNSAKPHLLLHQPSNSSKWPCYMTKLPRPRGWYQDKKRCPGLHPTWENRQSISSVGSQSYSIPGPQRKENPGLGAQRPPASSGLSCTSAWRCPHRRGVNPGVDPHLPQLSPVGARHSPCSGDTAIRRWGSLGGGGLGSGCGRRKDRCHSRAAPRHPCRPDRTPCGDHPLPQGLPQPPRGSPHPPNCPPSPPTGCLPSPEVEDHSQVTTTPTRPAGPRPASLQEHPKAHSPQPAAPACLLLPRPSPLKAGHSRSVGSSTCPRAPSPCLDPGRPCGTRGDTCHTG